MTAAYTVQTTLFHNSLQLLQVLNSILHYNIFINNLKANKTIWVKMPFNNSRHIKHPVLCEIMRKTISCLTSEETRHPLNPNKPKSEPHLTVHLNTQRHSWLSSSISSSSYWMWLSHAAHHLSQQPEPDGSGKSHKTHRPSVDCMHAFKMYVKLPVLSPLQLLVLINSLTAKQWEPSIHCLIIFVPLVIAIVYGYTGVL